jgi:TP53 regulating kinase-like protein
MRLLSQGAEAEIYTIKFIGNKVAAKVRSRKKYRVEELDTELREGRTRREARCMERAHRAGVPVPRLIACSRFTLYFEILEGVVLKDLESIPEGVPREIGRVLAKLHDAGMIHGDFTTANLMLAENGLNIIDFGLSEITKSVEGRAIDLLLIKRSLGKGYPSLEQSYVKSCSEGDVVVSKLKEIEKRGRYQIRTIT